MPVQYQTKKIPETLWGDISAIPLPLAKQQQAREKTGRNMNLVYAAKIIRQTSQDYTMPNPKAEKADFLFVKFLEMNGIELPSRKKKTKSKEATASDKTTQIKEAIEGISVLMSLETDEQKRIEQQEVIEALELLLL